MKPAWIVIAVFLLAIVMLYFLGGTMSEKCVNIDECNGCWSVVPTQVESSLCPNQTCTPDPYLVQHNVLIDVLLCACDKAGPDYANTEINRKISDIYKEMTCPSDAPADAECGIQADAREICENGVLSKWMYE